MNLSKGNTIQDIGGLISNIRENDIILDNFVLDKNDKIKYESSEGNNVIDNEDINITEKNLFKRKKIK